MHTFSQESILPILLVGFIYRDFGRPWPFFEVKLNQVKCMVKCLGGMWRICRYFQSQTLAHMVHMLPLWACIYHVYIHSDMYQYSLSWTFMQNVYHVSNIVAEFVKYIHRKVHTDGGRMFSLRSVLCFFATSASLCHMQWIWAHLSYSANLAAQVYDCLLGRGL